MICIRFNIFQGNYLRMDDIFKGFHNLSNYNPIEI
jgi:hypothetical protein